jgi:hypothetical protein
MFDGKFYLVRLRHLRDDVPLYITHDRDSAVQFAALAPWHPGTELLDALEISDISTPICLDVVAYGADGLPDRVIFTRDYDDETTQQIANPPTE